MSLRLRLMRFFLWVSVIGWGIGFGAKLFDLLIVAGAWGASPPSSLALMPYGPRYPMNPGDFFQPLSILMVGGMLGAVCLSGRQPLKAIAVDQRCIPETECFTRRNGS